MISAVPLNYRQIADDLARRIRAGEWSHGDHRMPTYAELAAEYHVSVTTMQRAIGLVPEGLILHSPGRGLFAGSD